jgi:hypothetical protein
MSGYGTNQSGPPLAGRPTVAPPVLSSPGSSGASGPGPGVAPGKGTLGSQPPTPGRPRRAKSDRSGTPAAPASQGAEWVGVDAARADASAPVLDAPAAPPTGAAVSGLEEVPTTLRASGTTATGRPATAGRRRGTVPPELAARRTRPATGEPAAQADGQKIVTDEDAFVVDTPGGGVLTKQPEDKSYRVEPPAALGGS